MLRTRRAVRVSGGCAGFLPSAPRPVLSLSFTCMPQRTKGQRYICDCR